MTSDTAVDSCVAVKWVLNEVDSPKARQLGTDVTSSGGKLYVLDIIFAEVGNAIWKQFVRGLITQAEAERYLKEFNKSPLEVVESRRLQVSAFAIACEYRKSFYDSLFVALAADRNLLGVTADEPLYRAVHPDFPNIILLRNW